MIIYVTHATNFDYKNELYVPLRLSRLHQEHAITLPHETSDAQFNSKDFIKTCDLIIAEVSYPSTGQGIELGWADFYGIPIVCVYKKESKISGSLKVITSIFYEYENSVDLIKKISLGIKTIGLP